MVKNPYKIILVTLIFGVITWLTDLFINPTAPVFHQLIFSLSPHGSYERVFLLFCVTISVAIALKTSSFYQKTKKALGEGGRLLDSIFASIQDGLIIKDRDFNIMRLNPAAARIFDYAMPLLGRKCYEALKGRETPCPDCPTVLALESGGAAHAVVPKPGSGGREVGWLDLYAFPMMDAASGEITGVIESVRDITQRKEAEDALEESETRYRLLVNNIPAVVFKGYLDWTIDFFDNKIEELTGYPKEDFDSRRLKWRDLILPEDRAGAMQEFLHALQGNKSYVREYRIRHQGGHIIWIQGRGQIISDLQGKAEYVSGVFFDITEHKQAEKKMARLASFPQLNPEPVLELDSAWQVTYCNAAAIAALEKLGVQAGEKAFFPEDLGEIFRIGRQQETVSRFYREVQIKDAVFGEKIEFVPEYDVARIRASDITERKQAEEALAESLRRYRLLAENVNDVIWTMDLQMHLTFVSPSVQCLTGYEAREYLTLSLEQVLTPASRELARNKLQEELALEGGWRDPGRSATLELELFRRDGSTVWAEVKASILRDDQGRPVGLLGVTRDISVRRKLEAQLQQSQKMEVVGRLAGGVAHDFNNLLTAILGYTEFLLTGPDIHGPARRDVLEIKKAGERAALLTRQLLAFSRRQLLQPKPLNLNLAIENLAKMLKRIIGEDLRLEIVYGADLGWVMADPGQMAQVVLNLLVNARDSMPRGGRITVRTANVELDEAYAQSHAQVQPGQYVMLAVTDTGCGMDAATLEHIFEPFFTTKEVGKGTGLGLSTVYGIVHQSGGHIWVYSEPGLGTTFKIYLPRVAAAAETTEQTGVVEETFQGHETILLVEDEEVVRKIAGRILRHSGYQVLEARDGSEALHICREHQGDIHLVLTDLVMPGINGRELVSRLTALRPEIKVALMSGYGEETNLDRKILDPGIAFIQKPFPARLLARKIWELLHAA